MQKICNNTICFSLNPVSINPSQVLILALLVAISAFTSGSEIALVSLSKSKVDSLVSKRVRNAKLLQKIKSNPNKFLVTILIANNVVNIGAGAYASMIFTQLFGNEGVGIATGVMTFIILVFGEVTPKAFCQQNAEKVALWLSKPTYVLEILMFPFAWFFESLIRITNRISGGKKGNTVTEGELVAMLRIGIQEGTIEKQEKELIENVLEFNDIQVRDVMTPRVSIEALDCETSIQDAVDFAVKHSHTRIPVYKKSVDHVVGMISIKELLSYFDKYPPNKKIKSIKLMMPLEVPLTKKINTLFREFQKKHIHMAIVIDEFGGTAGLATLEDLLEEIMGEIEDEFDTVEAPIHVLDEYNLMAKGSTLIEDINDAFRLEFWPNNRDTINNMLVEYLHRFPREGEIVRFPYGKVLVVRTKKNMVHRVKITKFKKKMRAKS